MPSPPKVARIKPPALQPGDTVGIVAPASNVKPELLEAGCAALRDLGYKPFYFDSIFERDLYFAGSADAAREGTGRNVRPRRSAGDRLRPGRIRRELSAGYSRSEEDQGTSQDFCRLQRSDHAFDVLHGRDRPDHFSRPHGGQGFCARRWRRSRFLGARLERIFRMGARTGFGCEIAGRRVCGRNSLRRMPLHSGGFFGHAL